MFYFRDLTFEVVEGEISHTQVTEMLVHIDLIELAGMWTVLCEEMRPHAMVNIVNRTFFFLDENQTTTISNNAIYVIR